ncbi:MAG: hypothetical protein M0Q49_05555 [Porticoccaceae bacterium]|nr:hypothetical protein [Porticoccaceae bacterium]
MPTIEYEASVGVGDGSGNLLVHGSYDAVKRVQAIILENERLRRMQAFNGLTPAEVERLALLVEEMGEAAQVIGKVLRHGFESYHPEDAERTPNRKLLEKELGDVNAAVNLMTRSSDLDAGSIFHACADKSKRVEQYLHHN